MANSTVLTTSGGKVTAWEGNDSWPTVNKVFNAFAFEHPQSGVSSEAQAPYQRPGGYGKKDFYSRRLSPQLTWFEGTYDVYAHVGKDPQKCAYPKVVGPMKDYKRECLDPGALSEADKAALKKEQQAIEASILASLQAEDAKRSENVKWECSQKYVGSDGKSYTGRRVVIDGKEHTIYTKQKKDGSTEMYSCSTDKLLRTVAPVAVKGLGQTDYEKKKIEKKQSDYRTTEYALIGALALAFVLVWRS